MKFISARAHALDHSIRTTFVEMNTELQDLYFARADRADVIGVGDAIKRDLCDAGRAHIVGLLDEGNTGNGFDSEFGMLGRIREGVLQRRPGRTVDPQLRHRLPLPLRRAGLRP